MSSLAVGSASTPSRLGLFPKASGATESRLVRRWAVIHLGLFALATVVFTAWPEIDLKVARVFYQDGSWVGSGQPGIDGFRQLVSVIVFSLPAAGCALWLFRRAIGRPGSGRATLGLLLSLALGPGLLVNAGLKETWGRARPSQVADFGRDRSFTPALVPASECSRNCSFASGEVATASGLLVLAWLAPRRRWLATVPGLALSIGMGLARMSAGAHFLSDAVFAGLISSATGLAVYWAVYRPCAELALGGDAQHP